jgi:Holliday junction resolvase RusA-like endonuclease
MTGIVQFHVRGIPVPQGSARAFSIGGKARIVTKSAPLTAWRTAIEVAASAAMGTRPLLDGPLMVTAVFKLPKPASSPKRRLYPDTRPDLDKLARSLLDALTGVVWRDDSRVVLLDVSKVFSDTPGVDCAVSEAGS